MGDTINTTWTELEKMSEATHAYAAALNRQTEEMLAEQKGMANYWGGAQYDAFTRELMRIGQEIAEETRNLNKLSAEMHDKAQKLKAASDDDL